MRSYLSALRAAEPFRAAGVARGGESSAIGWAPTLDALRVALFLLCVLTLSRIHQHFPMVAALDPAKVLAAVALAYVFLNPRAAAPGNLVRPWPAQVVTALAILACLSVPFGIAMGRSASFLVNVYAKVLIFAGLLMVATRHGRDLFLFVWANVLACGILATLTIFVFDLTQVPGDPALRVSGLYMYDANDAGLVLTVGLPLALLTLQTSKTPGKLLSALVLLGIGIALGRTGSRGAFLGFVAVAAGLLLWWPQLSLVKRVAVLGSVVLALQVAAPAGYWQRMGTVLNPTADYNWDAIDGRKAVALRGIGYMLDHPFFGIGIHNFERAEGTISEKAKEHHPGMPLRWTPPHNSFIQAGAELGIPGLLLWSCLVLGGIVAPIRLRRRLPAAWLRGDREERFLYLSTIYLPIAFLGFAVTSSFLSFAYLDPLYVLTSYLVGLYASLALKDKRDQPAPRIAAASTRGPGASRIQRSGPAGVKLVAP